MIWAELKGKDVEALAEAPDIELAEAAAFIGVIQLEAVILLNEAAVAWRLNEQSDAAPLAARAHTALSSVHELQGALLARCLWILLGGSASSDEIASLCEQAEGPLLMPGIGMQALALLGMAKRLPLGRVSAEHLRALVATVPTEHWDKRMDLLSVNECLAVLDRLTGWSTTGLVRG